MARKIVVTSGKGGVGKTTFTACLGIRLAEMGLRVALIDLDLGLNNLDVILDVENRVVFDLIDVIEGRCRIKQALIQDADVPFLYVMPGCHSEKRSVTAQSIKVVVNRMNELFDYILIDCPAGIDMGFHRSVVCADEALDVHRTYAVYELERRNLWSKSRHNVDTIAFGGTIKARRKPAAQPEFVAVAEEKHFAPVNPAQVSVNKKMVNDVIVSLFETREKRTRKDLIDEAMKHYGLSEMQLSERSSTSLATRYKSLTGSVINELLEQRLIEYEGTELRLVNTVQETQQSINYKTRILTLLSDGQPRTRAGILNEIAGENNRKAPDSSDNSAKRDAKKRAFVGTALRQLEDMGEVFRRNGRYFVKQSEKYPATPIGAHFIDTEKVYLEAVAGRLRRAKYENKLKMAYMKAININGSVFMEILALKAVKVLFGKSVVSDELTAGPNDNGIDGIVEVIDPLGFREKILIQAKTRQRLNTSVTVKELREFAGVMQGARAAKGVMATNASIHEEGKRFAATIPNLTCIDKDRLFDIALKHSLGIIYDENGIPFLDAGLFINYSLGVSQPRHD